MNTLIQSTLITLEKSKSLLNLLSDADLSDTSVSPYYSSIGSHIRHIYDFYDCAMNIDAENCVDLTARKRLAAVENCCDKALDCLEDLTKRLRNIDLNADYQLTVIDDLGTGKLPIKYTFAALLAQANSHTIHHYAIINYILDRLEIQIGDSDFGYNPSTPKAKFGLT